LAHLNIMCVFTTLNSDYNVRVYVRACVYIRVYYVYFEYLQINTYICIYNRASYVAPYLHHLAQDTFY
jgi:hypothetical protein